MQLYEKPVTSSNIFRRIGGIVEDAMDFLPETTAWFTVAASGKAEDIRQKKPQNALNYSTSYVTQRESFAGQPGKLYTARSNVLGINDPYVRTQGMEFIQKLQDLPLDKQQMVLAYINGEYTTASAAGDYQAGINEDVARGLVEDLGMSGQIVAEDEGLSLTDDRSGMALYAALKTAFPEIDLDIDDPNTAEQILIDLSDSALTEASKSASVNRLADSLAGIHTGETSLPEALWQVPVALTGVAGEFAWQGLGDTGRHFGAEGIVDDVASIWDNVEQGLQDTLVGYYDPALGAQVDGILNFGEQERIRAENPSLTEDEVMEEYNIRTEVRGNAFGLLTIVGGAALGGLAGSAGRRVKVIRSVIDAGDGTAIRAALPTPIKPSGGTGLIDNILEPARIPARAAVKKFDDIAIRLFAVSPDDFFNETMFGRYHRASGGAKLISALGAVKKLFPGDSEAALDAQVGYLRKRYGTAIPDSLVRLMLTAPDPETAKFRFVDYATRPQGRVVIQELADGIAAGRERLGQATARAADGEQNVIWQRNLKRYEELSAPEAQRAREETFGPVQGGMDKSILDGASPERKAELTGVLEEEVELAQLRRTLGFTPHTRDRTGMGFKPGDSPRVAPPEEGSTQTLSMEDVERLRDPELWDPETSMGEGMIGKLTPEEYQALKEDIAENGIREPLEVTVNPNTGEAIMSEGFHRWMVAKELGLEEVPVKIDYDSTVKGNQFTPPPPRHVPSIAEMQALSRERLNVQLLEERMSHTYDDTPMLHYPKPSHIRAIVRAPLTRSERYFRGLVRVATGGIDPVKFVDELPRRPKLYVPDRTDNPADWMDRNTTTIENVLHRVGVPAEEAAEAIGRLGRIRNSQEFFEVLEREIFGDGGLVDRHLHPSIAADKELRGRLIYLHDTLPESRTRSQLRQTVDVAGGRTSVDVPILAKQRGAEQTPLPSRPTEFLDEVALPNVDDLIEASSLVRRAVRNAERARIGRVSAATPYNMAKMLLHVQTAVLKPLVMLVRLPAMGLRIQLEQSLRMLASGYRPIRGMPEGWTLFPGGIPIPFSRKAAALGGAEMPDNLRVLSDMFGPEGWKMLDPDPRYGGKASQFPPNTEVGGFLEETTEQSPTEIHATGTQELRDDPSRITARHVDSHRRELEQASGDWLDRRIVAGGLNVDRTKEWLLKSRRGRQFMETHMRPQLEASTVYPEAGNPDGMVIELDAAEAAEFVEFPDRLRTNEPVGRTPEQIEGLRETLREGYNPEYVGDSGVAEGYLTLEYDPSTGNAIIREGHHRIGILAENGEKIKLKVKVVDDTPAVRGADVDEVDPNDLLAELSRLSPVGDSVGTPFDMDRFTGTPEARLDAAADAWLQGRVDYLKAITKEDPDELDFISTGKWRTRAGTNIGVRTFDPAGRNIRYRYTSMQSEIDNITAEIARRHGRGDRFSPDPDVKEELAVLEVTLRRRQRARAELQDLYPDELETKYLRNDDKAAINADLRRRWEENPNAIPDRIMMVTGGWHRGQNTGLAEDMRRWAELANSALYRPFNVLTRADRKFTRGSLWEQEYARSFTKYEAHGYSSKAANALAYADAGAKTRDLMYDLNARTSVQRALKDLFWFAPATQEVLYTWLVKIPSESYWPIGAASMIAKGRAGLYVLEEMGVISENSEGEKVIRVPFLGSLVEKLSGGRVKTTDIAYGKLSGLNLVTTGGGVPGLSTLGNFTLGRASLKFGGAAKALSDVFQPYGPEASLLPQPITFLHEAVFGEAPPFEPLSHSYTKAQWDRAYDQSIQFAYHELAEDDITPPRVEDFGTADGDGSYTLSPEQEKEFRAASDEYLTELMELGKDYAQGYAWQRLIGSTITPMSIYVTSTEKEQWSAFWSDLMGDEEGSGSMTERQRELVGEYLNEHPNSLAFSVFTTKYGAKQRDLPFAESQDDAYFDAYYTEEASTLTPEDFSLKLMATESRRFYAANLDATLRQISPDMNPWELLRNAGKRSAALTEYREEWERYLHLNPDAADLMNEQSRLWAESQNLPVQSYEAERLATTLDLLKQITPMLTGEDGIRPQELRAVQGQLAELYGDTAQFAEPQTKTAKAMGWWYENVMDPYLDKTATLWEEQEYLDSRGLDASHVYEELRILANEPPPSYKGQQVPSVEEFFWGNKTEAEREAQKVTWASRPVSWLSDFQLETVGYNVTETGSKFLREVQVFDEYVYNEIETRDIAPGSTDYEKWMKYREQELAKYAEGLGPEAVELLALNEAVPMVRVVQSGFGAENQNFVALNEDVQRVVSEIERQGFSAKGYSDHALEWKSWFYGELNSLIARDPGLATIFEQLSNSFVMANGTPRRGVVLYEALFFGNFNEDFIPQELAAIGG